MRQSVFLAFEPAQQHGKDRDREYTGRKGRRSECVGGVESAEDGGTENKREEGLHCAGRRVRLNELLLLLIV